MGPAMKRAAAVALAATVIFGTPLAASAAPVVPSGMRLSSPSEAPSGTPMWIRSITPCPAASSSRVHRFVEAWISPQGGSLRGDLSEVLGDVDANGHWQVTLSAPGGTDAGASAHYYVRAACLEDDPWAAAPLDEDTQVKPKAVAYYEVNPLWVTSSGGGGADGPKSDYVPDPAKFDIVTTTTAPRETTTTTGAPTTTSTTAAPTTTTGVAPASVGDPAARAAVIRKELASRGYDTSNLTDTQVLLASPASSSTPIPADGGIPWWAFMLATILAVGGVVGFGAKRSASRP
jgi:hypothetical protein